jgi:hypothetical protein
MAVTDPSAADRTTPPRHFGRTELATAIAESFGGAGPDSYAVGPLLRVRFLTQIVRQWVDGRTMLDAAIPMPSGRGLTDRRILADRGWTRPRGREARYYRRRFVDANDAFAGIISAYEAVYGTVGDDRGWTIRERWRPEDPPWDAARWTGQLADLVGRTMRPAADTGGSDDREPARPQDVAKASLVGLFCSWATLQSFGPAHGFMLEPALVIAIVVAELASAIAVSLTAVPRKLANANAAFWGGGAVTRAITAGSVYACASIASGMALVVLFATRQGGH